MQKQFMARMLPLKGILILQTTIIGIDLAKNVFQLRATSYDGSVVYRKELSLVISWSFCLSSRIAR